jgi:hypothetical protein
VKINSAAGKPADPSILVNVPKLITSYYELRSDPSDQGQRVVFGTSGHRGSALDVGDRSERKLRPLFRKRSLAARERPEAKGLRRSLL